MDQPEIRRRVAVYWRLGLFNELAAKDAAGLLWTRFAPIFRGAEERARAYEVPARVLAQIESQQVTPGSIRRELAGVFAKRQQHEADETIDRLSEILWRGLQHQASHPWP